MDALILAGGLGTRLAGVVADRAKPVAQVAGRPFVGYLLAQLERCEPVDRVVMCVGHKAETVVAALGERFGRLPLVYSRESEPLGTGGAMLLALRNFKPKGEVMAMNGDSFLGIGLQRLVAFHRVARSRATIALARVADGARYGAACLEGDRVVDFREKGAVGPAWINAGIYMLDATAAAELARSPQASFSFEKDVLGHWCAAGDVAGMRSRARFIDIGVPADYERSAAVLRKGV